MNSKTRIDTISTARALEIAVMDDCPPALWEAAEARLIQEGLCPYCACDGEQSKLLAWQPGDSENYAGRECPACESFIACGNQDSGGWLRPDEPDTDAAGQCYSDAVSGF